MPEKFPQSGSGEGESPERPSSESEEKKRPKFVKTAQGSVYTYLEDGRTQRYKETTGELKEPQDILVFIPPWEKLAEKAKELYPVIFKNIHNEADFNDTLLPYVKHKGQAIRPTDKNGKEILSLDELEEDEEVFLHFVDQDDAGHNFFLPVSKEPAVGYNTFDTRKYVDEDGNAMREGHIGNKVIDIEY